MSHVNPCPESQSMTDLSREFVRKSSSSKAEQSSSKEQQRKEEVRVKTFFDVQQC